MKYVVIIPDGLADLPLEDLDGKTPVHIARTPHLDRLAREGKCGMAKNVPRSMTPGSDVACLSLMGYDPRKYYNGRGPLEAASQKISVNSDEVVFRCNLVTIFNEMMIDYSGGHISSKEAKIMIRILNQIFAQIEGLTFYPGVSYRNLAVINEKLVDSGKGKLKTVPPHDILDEKISDYLPEGKGSVFLNDILNQAATAIESHEINKIKVDLGENPANAIWLWGQGKLPEMPSFAELYGLKGAVISAVDLVKGISVCAGLDVIPVPGITGYLDTDYAAKGQYAIRALEDHDIVIVHIEAPDEAGHKGSKMEKVQCIEQIDEKIVGPVIEAIQKMGQFRILVTPDHPTPIALRTHTKDPVPFVLWGTGVTPDRVESYSEDNCKNGKFGIVKGHNLISNVLLEKE